MIVKITQYFIFVFKSRGKMSNKKILTLIFLSLVYQPEGICSDGPNWKDIAIGSAIGFAGVALGSIMVLLASSGKQASHQAIPQQITPQLVIPQLNETSLDETNTDETSLNETSLGETSLGDTNLGSNQPVQHGNANGLLAVGSIKHFCDFVGQEKVVDEAKEFVDSVKLYSSYSKLGARKPRGLLIEGAPGNGKKLLVQAIVGELGGYIIPVNGNLLADRVLHTGDAKIRVFFELARQISKERFAVLFIDDFDVVARNNQAGAVAMSGDKTAYTLRVCIESIRDNDKILVIGSTSSSVKVDQKFFKPGCLDKTIHIPLPTQNGRKAILEHCLHSVALENDELIEDVSKELAGKLAGFSASQLKASVEDAALLAAQAGNDFVKKVHFDKVCEKLLLSKRRIDDSKQEDQFFYTFGDKTRFKDVIGLEEVLEEVAEAVTFVKNQDRYGKLGARSPKGLLLHGPSGCGKTLIARAIAGEGGCCFISISGSEFVKKYVGTGSMTVSLIFDFARNMSKEIPVVIFIDEIDGLGRRKSLDANGAQTEYNNTINEILKQMDGFSKNENILVIGATNLISELDQALIRPGRFDRKILVPLPCLKARQEIIKHYLEKKAVDNNLKSEEAIVAMARKTAGFSGADIENIINESAIIAVRKNAESISSVHIDEAIERVLIGSKNNFLRTEEEKKRTAYHEAGHTVIAIVSGVKVEKVSILSRGDSLGVTVYDSKEHWEPRTEQDLFNRIMIAQGGYVAEKLIFNSVSEGASSDLLKAGKIASDMIRKFGMGEKELEAIVESAVPRLSKKFDEAVISIGQKALAKTKELLNTHRNFLTAIAEKLLIQESLSENDLYLLQQNFHIVAAESK